jgi:hypothetical protein
MDMFRTAYFSLALIAIGFVLIPAVGVADGTTLDAWAAHKKEVVSACTAASSLRDAKPGGDVVDFDDRVGFSALVIDGRYPQPHMKGKRGRVLCLFDRQTRRPFVSDADSMLRNHGP